MNGSNSFGTAFDAEAAEAANQVAAERNTYSLAYGMPDGRGLKAGGGIGLNYGGYRATVGDATDTPSDTVYSSGDNGRTVRDFDPNNEWDSASERPGPYTGGLLARNDNNGGLNITLPTAASGPISARLSLPTPYDMGNPFVSYDPAKAKSSQFVDFAGVDLTKDFSQRALGDFAHIMSERSINNPALISLWNEYGVKPKSFLDGAGVLYFDEYSVDVKLGGNMTPASIIQGLVQKGPDNYIGYSPYSNLSHFSMLDMGTPTLGQIYNVQIGRELPGSSLYGDNGTVVLSDYRLGKDSAMMQLWTTDATQGMGLGAANGRYLDNEGRTMNGNHVVTGGRNLTIEPTDSPGVYRITNRGVSEPWGAMSRAGEGFFNLFYGNETGVQNANWQRMMTGLVNKIEANGGQAVTKPTATYGYVYAGGLQTGTRPTYGSFKKPF